MPSKKNRTLYALPPEVPSHLTVAAQIVFLEAVVQEAPQVLEGLREHVLPIYSKKSPHDAVLKEVIDLWAQRWGLTDSWVLDGALETLRGWKSGEGPNDRFALVVGRPAYSLVELRDIGFSYWHPWWDPTWLDARTFKKRVVADFEYDLDKYIQAKKKQAEKNGLQAEPQKRQSDHYRWLVRFQVLQQTLDFIAEKEQKDRRTIGYGIDRAAKEIGLTLRKRKPGRPASLPQSDR